MTLPRRRLLMGAGAAVGLVGAGWVGWHQMGSVGGMAETAAIQRIALSATPSAHDLIRYATLAANGYNTQGWRFRETATGIDILPDLSRRTPVVDPDDHHLFVNLGCATQNLSLAMAAHGRGGKITVAPDGTVQVAYGTDRSADTALFDAIPLRQSTRSDYDATPISQADLALLQAATVPGIDLVLLSDRSKITSLGDLVIAANSAQMADPAFVAELKHWLRFSPHAAMASGDGLYSAASGSPALPDWLGPRLFDMVFSAKSENAKYARQIASSSGIAVFVGAEATPAQWVQVGRACQQFALQATALGLKHAFLNQPVEMPGFRADLAALVGLPGRRPDIVMRYGRAAAMPFSVRRPVAAVMA